MPDVGYRSVEISVVNFTKANLTIQSASSSGSNVTWISGEQPKVGSELMQSQGATWGVMTNDSDGSAIGSVVLTGLGESPIMINLQNLANGQSQASVTANDKIHGTVQQQSTGEQNHSGFNITLLPIYSTPKLGKR